MYGEFVTLAARTAAQPRRASFGQPIPGAGALDPYWWDYVSLEQIEYLDSRVEHLNTDVVDYDLPDPPNPVTEPEAYNAWDARRVWFSGFKWDWTSFYTGWNQWVEKVSGNVAYRLGSERVAEYDNFRGQYNELRRRWRAELGEQATQAGEAKPEAGRPPRQSPVSEVTSTIKLAALAVIVVAGVWAFKGK